MFYRMVYDEYGTPDGWWYSPALTWEELLTEIGARSRMGCSLPGHVVDASLPKNEDPYAVLRLAGFHAF